MPVHQRAQVRCLSWLPKPGRRTSPRNSKCPILAGTCWHRFLSITASERLFSGSMRLLRSSARRRRRSARAASTSYNLCTTINQIFPRAPLELRCSTTAHKLPHISRPHQSRFVNLEFSTIMKRGEEHRWRVRRISAKRHSTPHSSMSVAFFDQRPRSSRSGPITNHIRCRRLRCP